MIITGNLFNSFFLVCLIVVCIDLAWLCDDMTVCDSCFDYDWIACDLSAKIIIAIMMQPNQEYL